MTELLHDAAQALRTTAAAWALDAASALVRVATRLRPAGAPTLRLVRDDEPRPVVLIPDALRDDYDALAAEWTARYAKVRSQPAVWLDPEPVTWNRDEAGR